MALNPTGIMSIGGPVTGSSINLELGLSATANSNMNQADFRTLAGIPSGVITLSNFYGKSNGTQRALYMYGTLSQFPSFYSIANLVNNTGVVAADTPITTPVRLGSIGTGYGGDKGIVFGGNVPPNTTSSISNLISNTGVVSATTPTSPSPARGAGAGCTYGGPTGTAILLSTTTSSRISNLGVVAAAVSDMGTSRSTLAATSYGGDKGLFYGGSSPPIVRNNTVQQISNTGVISAVTQTVGTARNQIQATQYGSDKGVFFGGNASPAPNSSATNYVSNTGVVAADTPSAAAARVLTSGVGYGGDKGIFAFGQTTGNTNTRVLVSNTGVLAADAPGVGTARRQIASSTYSYT